MMKARRVRPLVSAFGIAQNACSPRCRTSMEHCVLKLELKQLRDDRYEAAGVMFSSDHGTHGPVMHSDPSQAHLQRGYQYEQHRLARRRRRHHSRRAQLLRFSLIGRSCTSHSAAIKTRPGDGAGIAAVGREYLSTPHPSVTSNSVAFTGDTLDEVATTLTNASD